MKCSLATPSTVRVKVVRLSRMHSTVVVGQDGRTVRLDGSAAEQLLVAAPRAQKPVTPHWSRSSAALPANVELSSDPLLDSSPRRNDQVRCEPRHRSPVSRVDT